VASTRLTALALANLRKATLAVDASGKIIREIENESGKIVINPTTTTTTTTTGTGVTKITTGTDSGNIIVDVATTNLSIMGGSNISTKAVDGKVYLDLANSITITQATITTPDTTSPLLIKNSSGSTILEVTSEGVTKLPVKANPPTVTTGIIYASGLGSLAEGYYVGHLGLSDPITPVDPGKENQSQ
jgi:hypothetical protein